MPGLVPRLAIKGLGGRAVGEMDGNHHRLPLVDCWHPSLLEEGAGGGHHGLVAALNDAVLLWGVQAISLVLIYLGYLSRVVGGCVSPYLYP